MIYFGAVFPLNSPFRSREYKNSTFQIVLCLHTCLVIFNFILVIGFEKNIESICDWYLPPKRIFLAFSWQKKMGMLAIHDHFNPNPLYDIFCNAERTWRYEAFPYRTGLIQMQLLECSSLSSSLKWELVYQNVHLFWALDSNYCLYLCHQKSSSADFLPLQGCQGLFGWR